MLLDSGFGIVVKVADCRTDTFWLSYMVLYYLTYWTELTVTWLRLWTCGWSTDYDVVFVQHDSNKLRLTICPSLVLQNQLLAVKDILMLDVCCSLRKIGVVIITENHGWIKTVLTVLPSVAFILCGLKGKIFLETRFCVFFPEQISLICFCFAVVIFYPLLTLLSDVD